MEMLDTDVIGGPVPSLFAADISAARAAISANSARAHADMSKLARCFFMPETVSVSEATSLVKKPR